MPQTPRADGHDGSARSHLFRPPEGAKALSEWSLLPLRLFLGVTFTYAGFQKLANPNFFDAKSPISIQSQLIAAARTSPIHALLSHLGGVAALLGFSNAAKVIVCPCHGSLFQVRNGDVIVGPAPHGLTPLKIVEGATGNLYLQ